MRKILLLSCMAAFVGIVSAQSTYFGISEKSSSDLSGSKFWGVLGRIDPMTGEYVYMMDIDEIESKQPSAPVTYNKNNNSIITLAYRSVSGLAGYCSVDVGSQQVTLWDINEGWIIESLEVDNQAGKLYSIADDFENFVLAEQDPNTGEVLSIDTLDAAISLNSGGASCFNEQTNEYITQVKYEYEDTYFMIALMFLDVENNEPLLANVPYEGYVALEYDDNDNALYGIARDGLEYILGEISLEDGSFDSIRALSEIYYLYLNVHSTYDAENKEIVVIGEDGTSVNVFGVSVLNGAVRKSTFQSLDEVFVAIEVADAKTGLAEELNDVAEVEVFPNPYSKGDVLTILNEGMQAVDMEVYDMMGELVYQSTNLNGRQLQIADLSLSRGLYMMVLKSNDRYIGKQKLVVQ